jgi:hypothetical protein
LKRNPKVARFRNRLGLALLGLVAVTTLYAEGVLDTPWIDLFTTPLADDGAVIARPKVMLLLMVPVLGYLVAPRIRWLRDFLIIFTICCFMASGLDLLLRLPKPKNETQLSVRWLPQLPLIWRFDPNLNISGISFGDLAGRSRDPNLRELRTVVFQTDAAGFRNIHNGKGIDLVVLGDSFGAGLGTTQDNIFATLLETRYGMHVYNLSLPGSPHDEYLNFIIEAPNMTFSPNAQVVWLFFMGNDLDDTYREVWDPARLPWKTGVQARIMSYKNFRDRSTLRRMIIALHRKIFSDARAEVVIRRDLPTGIPILFHKLYEEEVNLSKAEVERHPHFPKLERTMVEMRNRAAERELGLTIVLIPSREEVYRWILERREREPADRNPSGFALAVLEACQRSKIRCLDTKPDLVQEAYRIFDSSGELVYWRDDTHFNNRGHEIMAQFIAREVLHQPGSRMHVTGVSHNSPSAIR